eukprot:evm.model.scf_1316.6 EVM.evm.TU.scf_1316.6   scf_1316:39107-44427(-)
MAVAAHETDEELGGQQVPLLEGDCNGLSQSCRLAQGSGEKDSEQQKAVRTLLLVLSVSFTFMLVEFVGGGIAHSLAIMTDAAHLLSDVCAFALSAMASYWASKRSKPTHSFGYHRAEVFGALVSVLIIWQVTGMLVVEAVQRLIHPSNVNGKLMFCVAVAGFFMNLIMIFILGTHSHEKGSCGDDPERVEQVQRDQEQGHNNEHSHDHSQGHHHSPTCSHASPGHGNGHADGLANDNVDGHANGHTIGHTNALGNGQASGHDNLSLRAALIHILGDMIQSIGVVVAGGLIWWHEDDPRWNIADPICTFFFAALVLCTTAPIFANITDVFMERVPRGYSTESIAQELSDLEGIKDVQDLHIWSLTPGIPLLSAHILVHSDADGKEVVGRTTRYCRSIGIEHTTIQVDYNVCHDED